MKHQIDWESITTPYDFSHFEPPQQMITSCKSWRRTEKGILFDCLLQDQGHASLLLEFLSGSMVRMRLSKNPIENRFSDILCDIESLSTDCICREDDVNLYLETEELRIVIDLSYWDISVYRKRESVPFFALQQDDRCFGPHYETEPTGFSPKGTHLTCKIAPGEEFYGFGEHFTSLNKTGKVIDTFCQDSGSVRSSRSYKAMPFYISTAGYGLMVNTSYPCRFDMGSKTGATCQIDTADDQLDLFLINGPDIKQVLSSYSLLTGKAVMPPKWSFGFWLSRCSYSSSKEVLEAAAGMKIHGLPLEVISIDPWWQGNAPWSTYQWDEKNFGDHQEMIQRLLDDGVRTCLWINPYLPEGTAICDEAATAGYLMKTQTGGLAYANEAFAGNRLTAVDFTNPEARSWFKERLNVLLEEGVALFKTDFGEQLPIDCVSSDGRTGMELHNLYPLLYNRTVFESVEEVHGKGITWGRSGYIGSQRYPLQWGGDSYASFSQMYGQLQGLLGFGLSGIPFCSHDIGGFDFTPESFRASTKMFDMPEETSSPIPQENAVWKRSDEELYCRWLQFGIFSSHVRAHGKGAQEPWTYGETVLENMRYYLNLRMRLLPYIYIQAVIASENGLPMVRPMVLEFLEDRNTRGIDTQYMFGEDILVAPVLDRRNEKEIYFPAGNWSDFYTGDKLSGPCWKTVPVTIERIPLFIRETAIIPLSSATAGSVGDTPFDELILLIPDPDTQNSITIYDEDDLTGNTMIRGEINVKGSSSKDPVGTTGDITITGIQGAYHEDHWS